MRNLKVNLPISKTPLTWVLALFLASFQAFASTASDEAGQVAAEALRQAQQTGQTNNSGIAVEPKTAANRLQIVGNFSYQISGGTVTVNVDTIRNSSSTRTTGTLRLELWATNSMPSREAAFTGYRVAVFATFSPLAPNNYYYSIVRTAALTAPPDGTYWMVLVLSEYDSVNCSASDHFCISDTGIFANPQTFGNAPPPPSAFYTVISHVGSQCYQNYPSAAWDILQQASPGLFQQYPSSTTCASLGMAVFAGYLGTGTTVPVYAPDIASAQLLCSTGLLTGCTYPPPPGAGTGTAVEYYYAAWNFYFETAFQDEIAALDGGAFGGAWKRTGQIFKVWPSAGNTSAMPTCRFFSTAFAPKSSHFYTPSAQECAVVKTNSAWQYEAIAFYIALADAKGLCSPGTIPLYRAYNNGMGGAPNHRYTTSLAILNQMIAAGWVFEGDGNTKVFACVPQ